MRAICLLSFTSLRQHPRPHGDHHCQKRPVSVARATASQTRRLPMGTRHLLGTHPGGCLGVTWLLGGGGQGDKSKMQILRAN